MYTVWGACEDVRVLEKFRSGEYKVDKLHIIDEANSRLLDIGGIKLRLLGLGGAVVMHKLFDNGEGKTTIAGGQGTMWTTLLQMGELVDTANRVYDPAETRVFVTHASPAREGMLNQLSVTLKADFSVSAGLHFRYGSSYNEFSVNPTLDHYRGKLAASKASFHDVWETVRTEVEAAISQNDAQKTLLENALGIVQKMPSVANGGNPFGGPVGGNNAGGQVDESAFKNMWNFNLADAAFGYLVLEVDGGRIGTEMRAQGFNFAHRGGKPAQNPGAQMSQTTSILPAGGPAPTGAPPTGPSQNRGAPPNQPFAQAQPQQPTVSSQPSYQQSASASQAQQSKPQTPAAPRAAASPAPTTTTAQAKPQTPQPTSTNVNIPSGTTTEKPAANGTSGTEKTAESPAPKPSSPTAEKKPSTGLFISNVETEQGVRELFPEEDKANIKSVDKIGKFNYVVRFETHEECAAALGRQPAEYKKSSGPGPNKKPNLKYYEERGPRTFHRESQGGAGTWQGSNRGASNTTQRGGYQSGGASDSEGGRGRGGYGARGRGGRGTERGGRGARGGRGSFNNKSGTGGDGASPAPSTPAASDKPSGGDS